MASLELLVKTGRKSANWQAPRTPAPMQVRTLPSSLKEYQMLTLETYRIAVEDILEAYSLTGLKACQREYRTDDAVCPLAVTRQVGRTTDNQYYNAGFIRAFDQVRMPEFTHHGAAEVAYQHGLEDGTAALAAVRQEGLL